MVRVEWRDRVLVVTIDRPERRNAVDHATLLALHDAQRQAVDGEARVLVLTGVKLLVQREQEPEPEKNFAVRLLRKWLPISPEYAGDAFTVRRQGALFFTPLFVVLIVIESTDLLFAIDSIPAVLGILPAQMPIEEKRFIAFTSNIFAIMGLRAMYFLLAGVADRFVLLKYGLALILMFIGVKMLLVLLL
jgi:tellurite resistance protein TerC